MEIFNGDGKLDVITVSSIYSPSASIFWGNGDGTLQAPLPLNQIIGNGYSTVASGDFNGDGKLDLVLLTTNFGSGAPMAILLGDGDGTFQIPITYSVPVAPYLVVGDFNHDDKLDIAVSGKRRGIDSDQQRRRDIQMPTSAATALKPGDTHTISTS